VAVALVKGVWLALASGYKASTGDPTIDQLITRGGMASMLVLPARMFKNAFRERGLAPVVLSRSLGDSATVTSALIPWNSCGAYRAATLGVATFSYAPFAVFNLLSPLITIAFAYLGIRMLRVAK
jgi:NhaC family Na+:H+ antiporter